MRRPGWPGQVRDLAGRNTRRFIRGAL